jgi:peptidoglycan/xylan/chitin deacetylase (PgdA/CDA1 family)
MNTHPAAGFRFTWAALETQLRGLVSRGYQTMRMRDYLDYKASGAKHPVVVVRVDIDFSLQKTRRLAELLDSLGIRATFFVRLHAPEYNPFSFEGYRVLRAVRDAGHELGYHSEVVDQAAIWDEDPAVSLRRDLDVMKKMLDVDVVGVASHGSNSGLNNLDFWRGRDPAEFGLRYEAYDTQPRFNLFHESVFVSDSNWTYWKCYRNGVLDPEDRRTPVEHADEGPQVLTLLVHPDTYFDRHFYEG